ncbi:hypothetical protein PT300_05100 [Enterobacteriaceae bacterium ESL0689]|nr:hypothetical protein [Enterobacteriaceae bacterium ESL0689]
MAKILPAGGTLRFLTLSVSGLAEPGMPGAKGVVEIKIFSHPIALT